ncbi:MAG: hypothetical protein WA981_16435 [Glaciecola sp.]
MLKPILVITVSFLVSACMSSQFPVNNEQPIEDHLMFIDTNNETEVKTISEVAPQTASEETRPIEPQTASEETRPIDKAINVEVVRSNEHTKIEINENGKVRRWLLPAIISSSDVDSILASVPSNERSKLAIVLKDIISEENNAISVNDNLMFIEQGENQKVYKTIASENNAIKTTIAVDQQDSVMTGREITQSDGESLTNIIVQLINTADLSDAEKAKIKAALK